MYPRAQPPPRVEIDLYWTDEEIILFLNEYTPKFHLHNVLEDTSPYQYPPSNLPEGFWYLFPSNEKKEYAHGFWKANAEACKVYSNSTIIGWRTTLQYFEGRAPDGQRTDWLMQEYWITRKELCDKDKSKVLKLSMTSDCYAESSVVTIVQKEKRKTKSVKQSKKINSMASINPNTNITSGQDSGKEPKPKECEVVADNKPNSPPQVFNEFDCFLRGDYLELNDLDDPESHSSSSRNSSCLSKLSDDEFDISAFLRDIEEEDNTFTHEQQSSSRYNFTSVRPDDVVLQPVTSGSLLTASARTDVVEGSGSGSTVHERTKDKRVLENTTERHSPDNRIEGTSNAVPSGEKRAGSSRMKKLKTYFCFKPF